MQCEMCGKDTYLTKALVEGSELNVCNRCSRYGKTITKPKKVVFRPKQRTNFSKPQLSLAIVQDYSNRIKIKRESLNLKQEDLAKSLNEKWSIIQKIEANNFKPNFKLARKLERFLKIKLVEQVKEEKIQSKSSNEVLTIGDLINNITI